MSVIPHTMRKIFAYHLKLIKINFILFIEKQNLKDSEYSFKVLYVQVGVIVKITSFESLVTFDIYKCTRNYILMGNCII